MRTAPAFVVVGKAFGRAAICCCASFLLVAALSAQCTNPTLVPNQTISSGSATFYDNNALKAAGVTINGSANVTFVAGHCIDLQPGPPGFHATAGTAATTFHAWVETAPTADSVTPSSGTGLTQQFIWRASSPAGINNLSEVLALFNTGIIGDHACYIRYDRTSNLLFLADDLAGNFMGGLVPGNAGTTGNSQCTINAAGSSVSGSGNQLTLAVMVTFQQSSFSGAKNNYLFARNNEGLSSGWLQMGTWTVGPPPDFTMSVSPASVTVTPGGSASYTVTVTATNGFAGGVNLAASSLPPGASASFSPTSVTGSGTSTLTITTAANTPAGNYTPTLTGTSGSLSHNASATLAVMAITTESLPSGTVGQPYNATINAAGGAPQYRWTGFLSPYAPGFSITTGPTPVPSTTIGMIATQAFNGTVNVSITDNSGVTTSRTWPLVIAAPSQPLTINTTSLPNGTAGLFYSQPIVVSGGSQPYTWSLAPGSNPLPPGLGFDTNNPGVLRGTPTTPGSYGFTVQVQDSASTTRTQGLALTVAGPLTITTSALPNGIVNTPYPSTSLTATGGTPSYAWTWSPATGSSLPPGLSLANGAINGTPTVTGTYTFNVQVSDSSQPVHQTNTKQLTITVTPPPLTITTNSLPDATVQSAYSRALAATGGSGSYHWSWSVPQGIALPPGLSLDPNSGVIAGTPTTAGTYNNNITVTVTDSASPTPQSVSATLSLQVWGPNLRITTSSLANGAVGVAYSQVLSATNGGTPHTPYTWTWSPQTGSSLPQCLNLATNGSLTGTCTSAGTFNVRIRVDDTSGQTDSHDFPLTIAGPGLKEYIRIGGRVIAIEKH